MNRKTSSYLYLALCIFFWASIPVASKKVLAELDSIQMLFYSSVFSFLTLGIIILLQKKPQLMKKYSAKNYLAMGSLGFLGTYLYYILLYRAFSLTTASEGFILAYTWPVLVIILASVILKERMTFNKILAVLISFFGIVIIATHGEIAYLSFTNLAGDTIALAGAFVFALFSVLGKKYNFDKTISAFIYFASSLIFSLLTLLIFSQFALPSINTMLWLLYNGIFVNGITYIFWFKALEYGDTSLVSNLLYLTPFLSLIYISVFLGEVIEFSSITGLVVIVSGIALQSAKNAAGKSNR